MAVLAPVEDRVLALVNAAAGECLRRYARPWADTSTGAAAGTAAEACWRSADNDGNGVLAADEIAAWFRQMGPDTAFLKLLSPFWQRTLPALAVQLLDCGAHCDDPTRPVVSASDFGVAVQEATGALERKIAGLRGAGQPGKRSAGAVLERDRLRDPHPGRRAGVLPEVAPGQVLREGEAARRPRRARRGRRGQRGRDRAQRPAQQRRRGQKQR